MFETNKIDNEYNNIREIIIDDKEKLKNIIFNKCVYYKRNSLSQKSLMNI